MSEDENIVGRERSSHLNLNTFQLHDPPAKDYNRDSVLQLPDIPAPPPTATSMTSFPSTSEAVALQKGQYTNENPALGVKPNFENFGGVNSLL